MNIAVYLVCQMATDGLPMKNINEYVHILRTVGAEI